MQVTYLGHAAILVESGGTTLLMDPWLEDPTYCNSWFHWPPLVHRITDLMPVDFVWCSHDHPDHFDPATLSALPRDQRILVPDFASGRLHRELEALGFTRLIPLPFDAEVELGKDLRVTAIRTDLVWEDSALVVRGGGTTLFNQNDCKLGDALLAEVGRRHRPDIAFLPFSGAIQYPTCYDYPQDELATLCAKRRRKHLEWFTHRAQLLQVPRAVPFAGNFALLHRDQLWMNEPDKNNINTPDEAMWALAARLPDCEGVQMNPGDRWSLRAGLDRHAPPPDFAHKMESVRALAAEVQPRLDALRAAEPPARADLGEQIARRFGAIAERHPELCTKIAARVVLETDDGGGAWSLDFRDRRLECGEQREGEPWNVRMRMPATLLQQALDGTTTWDAVALSFRTFFAEQPEGFNQALWVMLYNADPAFLESYLADPAPRF